MAAVFLPPDPISVSDIVARWGVPPNTVRWACRHGHLDAIKIGKQWFISARSAGKRWGRVAGKVSG